MTLVPICVMQALEAQRQVKEAQELMASKAQEIDVRGGDYQVQVHVIRVRGFVSTVGC